MIRWLLAVFGAPLLTLAVLAAPAEAGVDGEPWLATAVATATTPAVRVTPGLNDPPPGGYCSKFGREGWCCPQHYQTFRTAFLDAGWTYEATLGVWPTVDYIMGRESGCEPTAHNPSGARGLVQWMPFWYRGGNSYGWQFDPYDPYQALRHMALRVALAGWHDWCLRGDPVTGGC